MAATLTVYAYGNVDALHGIFNAAAMVMNSADFTDMIRVALIIGFACVLTLAAFGSLHKSWQWLLGVTVISAALVTPKADVSIEDKLGVQPAVVVANVPYVLAVLASVKSSFGWVLTQTMETAFQTIPGPNSALPAELSYINHGVMFGSKLVTAARGMELVDLYDSGDLAQYVMNCVLPEQGRSFLPTDIEYSTDLINTLGNPNPALSSAYHDANSNHALVSAPCDQVWNYLQPRIAAGANDAIKRAAARVDHGLFAINQVAAVDDVEQGLQAMFLKSNLAAAASTAAEIAQQNILQNAISDASGLYGASLNDPSVMMYASMRSQAVQAMNAGNSVQGRIAEEALPIVRNVTEALLYACFPVLCILLIASEGKALAHLWKTYVYVLVWVELWPPMFAIVNYLHTLEVAKALAGAAYTGQGTGMMLATATGILDASVSSVATTSWMITFVPVIAAALLFGFDKIMAVSGVMSGGMSAANSEASSWSKGNVNMNNQSFDKHSLDAYVGAPSMNRTESTGGVQYADSVTGSRLNQYRSAQLPVSVNDTEAIGTALTRQASVAHQLGQSSQKNYETSLDAAFRTARSAAQRAGVSSSKELGWDVSSVGQDGLGSSDFDSVAKKIANNYGIKDASQVSKALRAGVDGGLPGLLKFGGSKPDDGEKSDGTNKSSKRDKPGALKLGVSGDTSEVEGLTKDIAAGAEALRQTGLQRKHDFVEAFRNNEGFKEARGSDVEAAKRVESDWSEATRYREGASVQLSREKALRDSWEAAQRYQRQYGADWANVVDREFQRRGFSPLQGVADPRKMMDVLVDIVQSGSLRYDAPGGQAVWIPPDPGSGPNQVAARELKGFANSGKEALEAEYERVQPKGGRAGVKAAAAAYESRERNEEGRLGVAPHSSVDDGDVRTRVDRGQKSARTATEADAKEIAQGQGEAQVGLNKRKETLSDWHRPLPVSDARNKALDAVRFEQGTTPFKGEADAKEAAESDAARVRAANGSGVEQIPSWRPAVDSPAAAVPAQPPAAKTGPSGADLIPPGP
jgi:conjugal transfer mating pair stabilization protein TraG